MRQAATPAVTSLPRTRTEMELDHVITKHNLLVSHTHSRYYNHPIINFNNEFTQLYDSDYITIRTSYKTINMTTTVEVSNNKELHSDTESTYKETLHTKRVNSDVH